MSRRAVEVFVACCLSAVGLSTGVLLLLADPHSRLSRFVDRNWKHVSEEQQPAAEVTR